MNIGGKDRPVKYNFNALIEFEDLTGIDIVQSGNKRELLSKLKNMRALAYCGLKHGAKENDQEVDFSIEDVGRWLTMESVSDFFNAFAKDNSSGETNSEDEGEVKK